MKRFWLIIFLLIFVLFPSSILAVCPVCTVAVIGGLGISRWLKIDDVISGIWIGGLIISSGLWLASFMDKKNWKIPFKEIFSILIFCLFVILPLYWGKIIGSTNNSFWGIDKILLGIIIGSITFYSGVLTDKLLRKINKNKIYFYYQKVIVPVLYLSIISYVFYLITN